MRQIHITFFFIYKLRIFFHKTHQKQVEIDEFLRSVIHCYLSALEIRNLSCLEQFSKITKFFWKFLENKAGQQTTLSGCLAKLFSRQINNRANTFEIAINLWTSAHLQLRSRSGARTCAFKQARQRNQG